MLFFKVMYFPEYSINLRINFVAHSRCIISWYFPLNMLNSFLIKSINLFRLGSGLGQNNYIFLSLFCKLSKLNVSIIKFFLISKSKDESTLKDGEWLISISQGFISSSSSISNPKISKQNSVNFCYGQLFLKILAIYGCTDITLFTIILLISI